MPSDPGMKYWKKTGFIATMVIVLAFPAISDPDIFREIETGSQSGPFLYRKEHHVLNAIRKKMISGQVHITILPWILQRLQLSWAILTIMNSGIKGRLTVCSGKMGNSL